MTVVFVHTLNGGRGKWSRYVFPYSVECFAQLGDRLYIRSGDRVLRVVESLLTDSVNGTPTPFSATIQWPWVDWGTPSLTKQIIGFDIVGSGQPSVSFGYDQRNVSQFTPPYQIDADTLPGGIVPMPLMAPSLSVKVDFAAGIKWSLQSLTIYINEMRGQP